MDDPPPTYEESTSSPHPVAVVGAYLALEDLLNALRVCRDWNEALTGLLWDEPTRYIRSDIARDAVSDRNWHGDELGERVNGEMSFFLVSPLWFLVSIMLCVVHLVVSFFAPFVRLYTLDAIGLCSDSRSPTRCHYKVFPRLVAKLSSYSENSLTTRFVVYSILRIVPSVVYLYHTVRRRLFLLPAVFTYIISGHYFLIQAHTESSAFILSSFL